jgi:hypothetical protein
VKTTVLSVDVSDNLTVKMGLPKNFADEYRNTSEYKLNSVTWSMRSRGLNVDLMTYKGKVYPRTGQEGPKGY